MTDDTVDTLNTLIETLEDSMNGFETAAADVKSELVKSEFKELADHRSRMAAELRTNVRRLGGEAHTSGSAAGTLHRGWMNLKSALGGGEKAILNEAERGEDVAIKAFEKAMQEPLPPDVASVVRRQFGEVRHEHDHVRNLRDSWK